MVKVLLAQSAWEDLDSISDYIAQDSIRYAQEFSNELLDKVKQLESFPDSGKIVVEFINPLLRELIYKKYRIVYRYMPEENKAIVLRIIHGSKLLDM
ncbi:type II toxin-antitoxin system RelE/ParE family toxin [Hyphobacterium sp. CCMP332]|nr:type II toxin-antitoxin system RelE/ParE family toxin [Hyphobacterium sp. CCMP332]